MNAPTFRSRRSITTEPGFMPDTTRCFAASLSCGWRCRSIRYDRHTFSTQLNGPACFMCDCTSIILRRLPQHLSWVTVPTSLPGDCPDIYVGAIHQSPAGLQPGHTLFLCRLHYHRRNVETLHHLVEALHIRSDEIIQPENLRIRLCSQLSIHLIILDGRRCSGILEVALE